MMIHDDSLKSGDVLNEDDLIMMNISSKYEHIIKVNLRNKKSTKRLNNHSASPKACAT